jgi:Peroxidase
MKVVVSLYLIGIALLEHASDAFQHLLINPNRLSTPTHHCSSLNNVENDIVSIDVVKADSSTVNCRRSFLLSTAMMTGTCVGGLTIGPLSSMSATGTSVDYKAVAGDVTELIKANPDWGPTLVRLAWHSSGTYDKMQNNGGSGGGTIRFKEELAHGGNAGLATTAVEWMEPVHSKYAGLSYADLYTLAGGAL